MAIFNQNLKIIFRSGMAFLFDDISLTAWVGNPSLHPSNCQSAMSEGWRGGALK